MKSLFLAIIIVLAMAVPGTAGVCEDGANGCWTDCWTQACVNACYLWYRECVCGCTCQQIGQEIECLDYQPVSTDVDSIMEKISCADADGCTWDFNALVCCKYTGFWPFCFASCKSCEDLDRDGVCDLDNQF